MGALCGCIVWVCRPVGVWRSTHPAICCSWATFAILNGSLSDTTKYGAMAQLVARFHGMEEVRGSNPLSSTISATILRISVIVALFFYRCNVRVEYVREYARPE